MLLRCFIFILLACLAASGREIPALNKIQSNEELARYISTMTTNSLDMAAMLQGLDDTNKITVDSNTVIPIREVFGTIVEQRFQDNLGKDFYEPQKKYGVREICSYQINKGEVYRFQIVIFDAKQYEAMKNLLRRKMRN